jgi:hypothetical protein
VEEEESTVVFRKLNSCSYNNKPQTKHNHVFIFSLKKKILIPEPVKRQRNMVVVSNSYGTLPGATGVR